MTENPSSARPSTDLSTGADVDYRVLPKVSLHDHLDGGLRPATILELADAAGHRLPSDDPAGLRAWFVESADSGSLPRYLETFDHTIAVMQTADGLARVAREFVEDLVTDGVVYGEVRWAPEQHLRGGLSLDETVEAVQAGIEEAVAGARADGRDIIVGQLVSAMRQADNGLTIAELALRHRDRGVVGFDIAGPEDGFAPSRMADAFELLARNLFPVTVHAGEAAGLDSITDALAVGRALRLGHGVRIASDLTVDWDTGEEGAAMVDFGPVARWVLDRQIPLELCPSSNLQTGAVAAFGDTLETHPFDLLYQTGFHVTVNTDNRLMSNTTISDEMALLVETFDYDLDDLLGLTLNAVDAAFAPLTVRAALAEAITAGYDGLAD